VLGRAVSNRGTKLAERHRDNASHMNAPASTSANKPHTDANDAMGRALKPWVIYER
jgi:hypothetical protein